jgi:hypothetical protein
VTDFPSFQVVMLELSEKLKLKKNGTKKEVGGFVQTKVPLLNRIALEPFLYYILERPSNGANS